MFQVQSYNGNLTIRSKFHITGNSIENQNSEPVVILTGNGLTLHWTGQINVQPKIDQVRKKF
jgi:hypothetical protein